MTGKIASEAYRSIRRHLLLSVTAVLVLLVGAGGWAVSTELAGAVIAEGQLVVDSNVKKIQHQTGGLVSEIRVNDGDRVKAGDLLVRLDATDANANLQIIVRQMDELAARQARIAAEMVGAEAITFPDDLLSRKSDPALARVMAGETDLFLARRSAREGQKAQYRQQVDQLNEQIAGLSAQRDAKQQEIDLNAQTLAGLQKLWDQRLTQLSNLTTAQRDGAKMAGELGSLKAAVAEAKGKIAEIGLKIIQVDEDVRTEDGKELADIRANLGQLTEKRLAAEEQLRRLEVRAPQDGTVHELAFHTVGGVVGPGEAMMLLVPDGDALSVDAKVRPQDIDQLHLGQDTMLRLTAFNQRTTPEVDGKITRVSPDVVQDPKTGATYYSIRIALDATAAAKLKDMKLVPGMPVEAFFQTAPRTVISYLVRPFSDQLQRTFRED